MTKQKTKLNGKFHVQCFGMDGELKWGKDLPNGIVDVGIEQLLDAGFNGGTQISTWYMGFINNAGFSALANADTMPSHAGWTELTDYAEATRPEWTAGAAATRAVTNAVTVDFSINATVTIKGIFITSVNVKGDATGTLWSTVAFASFASAINGDTLRVTYTVTG